MIQCDDLHGNVKRLTEAWARCWNDHNMAAAANLVSLDVDFVTVSGKWLRGADEFLAHHGDIHRTQMRDSTWSNIAYAVRPLVGGLLLVHIEWAIDGDRYPDDAPRRPRRGVFTWIVACHGTDLRIVAAHNTDLRHGIEHRLARIEARHHL
jgi:uncharacterized protein (TIGR02246 family)